MVTVPLLLFGLARADAATGPRRPIEITVDATEVARRILHVRERVPVDRAGTIALAYPRWMPGGHAPLVPVINLAGLVIRAAGKALPWRRDEVDLWTFRVDVPAGVVALDVEFDYLVAGLGTPTSTTALATEKLAVIEWAFVVLYPEGKTALQTMFVPAVRAPAKWEFATALSAAPSPGAGDVLRFAPVTLERLIDSPVLLGAYLRRFELGEAGGAAHAVVVAADSPEVIDPPPEMVAGWKRLPSEALALFGARHYTGYQFLYALTNQMQRPSGLEHHESSDNRAPERALVDDAQRKRQAGLLPHEFVHSWNGKYRRPLGLCTSDLHQPMRDDLLWVYEGLTSYLGEVLAARSGLRSPELAREALALTASEMSLRTGRAWRPLQDTSTAAAFGTGGPDEWSSWRRGLDYYPEGVLLWLEVDTMLRRLSQGRASIDDFAHRFHGGTNGPAEVRSYRLEDLVATLESLAPGGGFGAFLRTRLDEVGGRAPLGGIEASGWRLSWNERENEAQKAVESVGKTIGLRPSLGCLLRDDGTIIDVNPGMPAAQAGASPGMKVRAVNGRRFTPDVLRAALRATTTLADGVELVVENDDWFRSLQISYKGGPRYPHLERIDGTPDVLSAILAPHVR